MYIFRLFSHSIFNYLAGKRKNPAVATEGKSHEVADCLSRLPVAFASKEDEEAAMELPLYQLIVTPNDLRIRLVREQKKDPRISKLITTLPKPYIVENDMKMKIIE